MKIASQGDFIKEWVVSPQDVFSVCSISNNRKHLLHHGHHCGALLIRLPPFLQSKTLLETKVRMVFPRAVLTLFGLMDFFPLWSIISNNSKDYWVQLQDFRDSHRDIQRALQPVQILRAKYHDQVPCTNGTSLQPNSSARSHHQRNIPNLSRNRRLHIVYSNR